MARNSKKRKSKNKKLNKKVSLTDTNTSNRLSKSLTTSQLLDEEGLYRVSFSKYNTDSRWDIKQNLKIQDAKKALVVLNIIGTKVRSTGDLNGDIFGKEVKKKITRKGEYLKLYQGLSKDTELREIKLSDEARLFYFDIESAKTFYVVVIATGHLETNKNRR